MMTDTNNASEFWQEGNAAYHDGLTDADNPYSIGTDAAMDWEDGRSAAEQGDEE